MTGAGNIRATTYSTPFTTEKNILKISAPVIQNRFIFKQEYLKAFLRSLEFFVTLVKHFLRVSGKIFKRFYGFSRKGLSMINRILYASTRLTLQ